MKFMNVKQLADATGLSRGDIDRLKLQGRFKYFPGVNRGYKARLEDVEKAIDQYMEEQVEEARQKWQARHGVRDFDFDAHLEGAIRDAKKTSREKAKVIALPTRTRRKKGASFADSIDRLRKDAAREVGG